MDLGNWVLNTRKNQGQDIRTLAEKTGVDVGTISRIENLHTQATVLTTFRLSEGLGTPLPNLIEVLSGKYPASFETRNLVDDATVLTLKDVKLLVDHFTSNDGDKVRAYLVSELNHLVSNLSANRISFRDGEKAIPFNIDDIDKLLFRSRLYTFDLRYPWGIGAKHVRFVYDHNGALMLSDINSYLGDRRSEELTRPSSNILMRIGGPSPLDRMKFNELLSLDQELQEDGRLLGLFWEVCTFEETFNPPPKRIKYHVERSTLFEQQEFDEVVTVRSKRTFEYRLARLYVVIYRWHQYLSHSGEVVHFEKY